MGYGLLLENAVVESFLSAHKHALDGCSDQFLQTNQLLLRLMAVRGLQLGYGQLLYGLRQTPSTNNLTLLFC